MIQIRLSADSIEELASAKQEIKSLFTIYRLKGSEKSKNGRYKAYLIASLNTDRTPKEHLEQ